MILFLSQHPTISWNAPSGQNAPSLMGKRMTPPLYPWSRLQQLCNVVVMLEPRSSPSRTRRCSRKSCVCRYLLLQIHAVGLQTHLALLPRQRPNCAG